MNVKVRPSGIPAVGDVAWGTHICNFYQTAEDLAETLVPYFKAGLDAGERCLWITCQPLGVDAARAALSAAAPGLQQQLARGQIEILDHREWYTRGGCFDANGCFDTDEVLAASLARERDALASGYAGLRLTGNAFWLHSETAFRNFIDYEEKVNAALHTHQILVLCSYSTERCGCESVFDVVRSHHQAFVRRRGNWEVVESVALKLAKEELRRLNAELEERVRQRTAELQAALSARDDFLCMASHELKTPLAALQLQIQGLCRGARYAALGAEQTGEGLQRALGYSRRLTAVVDRILDISRALTGPLEIEVAPCSLCEIVREVVLRHTDRLDAVGVTVTIRTRGEPIGRWDRSRMEQVIADLLSNSMKHAPGTPIEIDLATEGTTAVLCVRDYGPGIAEDDRERIFERFEQLGCKPRPEGVGLGLWLARRIIEAHGGTIGVSAAEGGGASFVARIPLDASIDTTLGT